MVESWTSNAYFIVEKLLRQDIQEVFERYGENMSINVSGLSTVNYKSGTVRAFCRGWKSARKLYWHAESTIKCITVGPECLTKN